MQDVTSPYFLLGVCFSMGVIWAFNYVPRIQVKAGDLESYVLMWTAYTLNHLLIIPGIFVCLARSETRVYVKRIITNISLRQRQSTATVTPSTLAQPNTKY